MLLRTNSALRERQRKESIFQKEETRVIITYLETEFSALAYSHLSLLFETTITSVLPEIN